MSKRTSFLLFILVMLVVVGAIGLLVINQQSAGYGAQINSYLTANPPP